MMRSQPVEIDGFEGCVCSSIKLSDRLRWRDASEKDRHIMIPALLELCIMKDGARLKTMDEWDEWAGDNTEAAGSLFNQCIQMIGTVEQSKKK